MLCAGIEKLPQDKLCFVVPLLTLKVGESFPWQGHHRINWSNLFQLVNIQFVWSLMDSLPMLIRSPSMQRRTYPQRTFNENNIDGDYTYLVCSGKSLSGTYIYYANLILVGNQQHLIIIPQLGIFELFAQVEFQRNVKSLRFTFKTNEKCVKFTFNFRGTN